MGWLMKRKKAMNQVRNRFCSSGISQVDAELFVLKEAERDPQGHGLWLSKRLGRGL